MALDGDGVDGLLKIYDDETSDDVDDDGGDEVLAECDDVVEKEAEVEFAPVEG